MKKAKQLGMELQQRLSFSGYLTEIQPATNLFWPGCALMNLELPILQKTWAVLNRYQPMGVSSGCCGQPTLFLQPGKHPARAEWLSQKLEQAKVQTVYTACPNCTLQMKQFDGLQVQSIWPVLEAYCKKEDLAPLPAAGCNLHDPCPTRKDTQQQAALRGLLEQAGMEIKEPEHTGASTLCCGNRSMMQIIHPEKSKAARQRRVAEFDPQYPVVSSCEGCLSAFRGEGLDTLHLLEVLFGASHSRGLQNRLAFTKWAKQTGASI